MRGTKMALSVTKVSFHRCRSKIRFPLSLIPLSLRQNRALEHLQKDLRKTCNIAGVPSRAKKNSKKPASNEQMKKLFDSGELGRAESKTPAQLQRTT